MTENEYLFLKTLEDIENKIQSNESYEVLLIAALIRKLFLDSTPLVDQVNKSFKIKFKFVVACLDEPFLESIESLPGTTYFNTLNSIDPESGVATIIRKSLNKDQFFQMIVIITGEHRYSVKDVVRYLAHIRGAVHIGEPITAKDHDFKCADQMVRVNKIEGSFESLRAIARIVIRALSPLKTAVLDSIKIRS